MYPANGQLGIIRVRGRQHRAALSEGQFTSEQRETSVLESDAVIIHGVGDNAGGRIVATHDPHRFVGGQQPEILGHDDLGINLGASDKELGHLQPQRTVFLRHHEHDVLRSEHLPQCRRQLGHIEAAEHVEVRVDLHGLQCCVVRHTELGRGAAHGHGHLDDLCIFFALVIKGNRHAQRIGVSLLNLLQSNLRAAICCAADAECKLRRTGTLDPLLKESAQIFTADSGKQRFDVGE